MGVASFTAGKKLDGDEIIQATNIAAQLEVLLSELTTEKQHRLISAFYSYIGEIARDLESEKGE